MTLETMKTRQAGGGGGVEQAHRVAIYCLVYQVCKTIPIGKQH